MSLPTNFDATTWAQDNHAVTARVVDGELVAVMPMTFGKFRLTIGTNEQTIDRAY